MDTAQIAYRDAVKAQVREFIDTGCEAGPNYETRTGDLYAAYREYAAAKGWPPVTTHMFGRLLREQQVWRRRDSIGVIYVGISPS